MGAAKCHVNCVCHRLSTSINTAWDAQGSQKLFGFGQADT